jgi:hypothetical protein
VAPELCDDVCRAKAAAARYAAGGDLSDLHAACAAWQGLWSQAAFETAPATWRVGALSEAGGAFLQRYCRATAMSGTWTWPWIAARVL